MSAPAEATGSPSGGAQGLPPPGSVLGGKYQIGPVLGRGGMGLVVQARHLRLNRDVALKILLPALREQPDVVTRFEREGRAAAQLTDVHVARVLDVDTLPDGSPFIVMELLRGEDLADVLTRRGRLPYRDAVGYLLEACAAMAEAHRMGIVHRDLKPNNLFIDKQGERPVLKVLDFGISKITGDVAASVTATATAFGTPLYMSPEQVRSARSVDGRADIWSLGVVLYELLAGESPFSAPSATAILAAIIADAPADIGAIRPDLPRPLADAVMRSLQKDPAARFQDVQSFAAALAPFGPDGPAPSILPSLASGGGPTPAATSASTHVPVTTSASVPRRSSGGAAYAPLALGMLLAIVGGAFVLLTVAKRPASPAARAEPSAQPPAASVAAPPVVAPAATVEATVGPTAALPATPPPAPAATGTPRASGTSTASTGPRAEPRAPAPSATASPAAATPHADKPPPRPAPPEDPKYL